MIEVQEINSRDDLQRLGTEWDSLARRVNPSLFLSHGWFMTCVGALGSTERPRILVLREGGNIVGIAPLLQRKTSLRHMPLTQVGFLDNNLTPFCDFLLVDAQAGVRAILDHLVKCGGFDVLRFQRLLSGSPNLPALKLELERRRMPMFEKPIAEVVYLPIAGEWDAFYNARSRKFRMTRRSVANKIARLGKIGVECAETPEQLKSALAAVLDLSAQGWKRRENRDLLGEDVERRLLTSMVEWAGSTGHVRIWLLRKDQDVIAAEFHLVDSGTAYGLRAQYDPQYYSHSPGRALDYEIVERLFQAGFTTYDMGPGVAEYKRNWSDDTYTTLQVEAFADRFYPQLAAKIHYRLVPALKQSRLGKWLAERNERKTKSAEPPKSGDPDNAAEPEKDPEKLPVSKKTAESAKKTETEKECPTVKSES
jgi:CelD/BcsL family acetyltransferase involved in cellulose biosynthesis